MSVRKLTEGLIFGKSEDRILQYHPENLSHHGGTYFKISSGETGTIRIDLDGNLIN